MRPAVALLFALALSACADFPALDARMTEADRNAPFPGLVPLGPLLAAADARAGSPPPAADLPGRIAALNARAAALRGPVIDAATTARIADALR